MRIPTFYILLLASVASASASAATPLADEVVELRRLLDDMRGDYESRIGALEARLQAAERRAGKAERAADDAIELAERTAIAGSSSASAPNTFNPALGAVLMGRFADVGAGWEDIPGFQPAGEIGTGGSGFSLSEAELNLKAAIDPHFFGNLTLAVEVDDGEVELGMEEAWLQTTSLSGGLSLTGGRFFSAAGYLNGFHVHADDFVDRPLPYQAFFGGRYTVDGVQARWVAPASLLVELGAELNWAGGFPATDNGSTSAGATTLFAKFGCDIGLSNSWLVGLSRIEADARERGDAETFTGDSDLTLIDFVWKWAPAGNPALTNAKVQGEYFRRSEQGSLDALAYDGTQTGGYLQAIWQFAPQWRVGLRHDFVDADSPPALAGTSLEDPNRKSRRNSAMLDWSASEYSRFRLQYTDDRVLDVSDDQFYLQYIMSIGAHGAHQY